MSKVLTVERREHVAVVWLDRPEARNAFGPDMWVDFPAVMADLAADDGIRALVVAARGPAFTVGLDLAAFGPGIASGFAPGEADRGSPAANRMGLYRLIRQWQEAITSAETCGKPVIVAVHGWCIGAGVDLMTACDIRIAAADAVFSVRETKLAIVADVGTLQRLPRIIGPGKVAELAFTGRDVTADEALAMGLVDQLHPDADAAHKAAFDLAAEIAANSPLVVQGIKAVLQAGRDRTVADALDYVALWNTAFLQSNDLNEAVAAFLEKRPPDFTGT